MRIFAKQSFHTYNTLAPPLLYIHSYTCTLVMIPYLQVTPSSAVERDDFYTLGLSGVTHFSQGKAEFTPLERCFSLLLTNYVMWRGGHLLRLANGIVSYIRVY